MDRKASIIEAAKQCFTLWGYKATTMDTVAKTANVGKGTIYTFFKNKEELFEEIMTMARNEIKGEARRALQQNQDLYSNIHDAFLAALRYRHTHPLTIRLAEEARLNGTKEVIDILHRMDEGMISFIETLIQEAIEKGEIRECRTDLAAFLIFKIYWSMSVEWERHRDALKDEELAQLMKSFIATGLAKEGEKV